jgi:chromosome partitioning protein
MSASVVTVAQQKGGAGKTTLAIQLAVAWAGQGRKVALLDIDPQESLSAWYWLRDELLGVENGQMSLEAPSPGRCKAVIDRLRKDNDIIVIDSPPHTRSAAKAGIANADLVLVPIQLSPMDLWATKPTLQMARDEKSPAMIVLNRVPPRGRVADEIRAAIDEKRLPMAKTILGNRSAYAASLLEGQGVTEAEPSSPAAAEIRALAGEVMRRLGGKRK